MSTNVFAMVLVAMTLLMTTLSSSSTLLFVNGQTLSGDLTIKTPKTSLTCQRTVTYTPTTTTVTFDSTGRCNLNATKSLSLGTFTGMNLQASVSVLPMIKMTAQAGVTLSVNILGKMTSIDFAFNVGASMGFDAIFEYLDNDSNPGYQPSGTDQIVKSYPLTSLQWSQLNVVSTKIDANTTFYQLSTEAQVGTLCKVKLIGYLTTSEVVLSSNAFVSRDGVQQILVPSSFKTSLQVLNIAPSNAAAKIGISTLVAFRGKVNAKSTRAASTPAKGEERPDDDSADQSVLQVDTSSYLSGLSNLPNGFQIPKPFFSYQTFVSKLSASGTVSIGRSKLVSTSLTQVTEVSDVNTEMTRSISGSSVWRFYASLTEQVQNFVWDPSVGNSDERPPSPTVVSGAHKVNGMVVMMMMVGMMIMLLFM
ncbi:hypothetical protein C9374_009369 [Naegleria lovaniensis]|uniref:Uncharacterized protein n=1 Tax=Naegleria lovaniensis TaxID=51637 RepID=A0AA88KH50_NAELO|nr:uncharacterized protein C9374_009369 [Naegleria lovaniensis]KAG2377458.1 hypothetical protein C9374_009369 [Naegleria lovaniensis]